ncbi:MAG: hypothetical protein ABW110_18685, partial [Steroidobacteraceae bacterium]
MAYSPWIGNLTVRGVAGNYGTVKALVDETAPPTTAPLMVRIEIARQGLTPADFDVEVFTNLNRRDFAVAFEALSASNGANSYWVSHTMAHQGQAFDNLVFAVELPVTQCGAYRLTARYRLKGTAGWWWHNDFSPFDGATRQRDCAIVVSPAKAATARLYEAN